MSQAATVAGSASRQFPGLNHTFIAIKGEANGYDEFPPGHVAPEVISAIAQWINRQQ